MNTMSTRARVSALVVATSVLVLSGLVAAAPASAAPVGNYADLQTAFNASGTVELTASISSPASELVLADGATQVLNLGAFNLNVLTIQVGVGSSLTITGTTGVLTADASSISGVFYTDARAGIAVPATSTLVIASGVVHATGGGTAGAGLGGQSHGTLFVPGSVSITGGTVVAVGSGTAAGIGGSAVLVAGAGSVSISGGNVTASASQGAAGIGGGWMSHLNSITISGGTVHASATGAGAGIGGGDGGGGAGTITISAGNITATSENGAAIGSGTYNAIGNPGGGPIVITGGTIDADSSAGSGAAIGAGYGNQPVDITISNATITATSDEGAGIGGGGFGGTNGTIIINSGTFDILSQGGAGIGSGGFSSAAGSITVNGGTFDIFADGGGAAIGGGFLTSATSITLNGGTFTLESGTLAPVIGSGVAGGAGGTILIANGVIASVRTDQTNTVVGGTSGSANITLNGRLTILDGALIAPTSGGGLTIGTTGVLRGVGDLQGAAAIINNGSITGSVNVTATNVQVNNFLVTYTAAPSVSYAGGTQRVYATNFTRAELALADPVPGYDVQWYDAPVGGTLFTTLTTLSADITLYPAFSVSALANSGVELGLFLPIGVGMLLLGLLFFALRRTSAAAHTIAE